MENMDDIGKMPNLLFFGTLQGRPTQGWKYEKCTALELSNMNPYNSSFYTISFEFCTYIFRNARDTLRKKTHIFFYTDIKMTRNAKFAT